MFQSLTDYVSGSPWTYPFLVGIAALDVIFPLVPSETSVILAGVVAATGDLILVAVIACAAGGAILGDNVSYWIGRLAGERIVERFFTGERRKRIDWAEKQIEERGPYLIVIGRFIPGGRTAVTLASGLLEMPWRRFIVYDVAAGIVWASYAALLGYVGGRTFEENPLKAFLIAFAVALAVTAAVEVYRWLKKRRVLPGS
jgi:membrane protein DedA with SNARE-associated domain